MQEIQLPNGMHVLERGWLSSNNILFIGKNQTTIVDSGYCTHADQTLSLVESVLAGRELDILANTHLHSDHCGGNAALQQRYAALRTFIPPGQATSVKQWDPVALTYVPTGQSCPRFDFTGTLKPGTSIEFGDTTWDIHAAPGHDPHSVIYFEPVSKTLISADALWEKGFGVVFPELEGEEAFSEVAATLKLIAGLKPDVVIPGHGRPFKYTTNILDSAEQRLQAFVSKPQRHAQHAAKVLLKFKLLEVQKQSKHEFEQWAISTPYLMKLRDLFFSESSASNWITQLCDELTVAGVARQEPDHIFNM